ncbi:hypothetical protein EMIT0180MI3_10692 [Priestia megaterium]
MLVIYYSIKQIDLLGIKAECNATRQLGPDDRSSEWTGPFCFLEIRLYSRK